MSSLRFTLYARSYCHLCDDMLAALQAMLQQPFAIDVIDIDAPGNALLLDRYDTLVPVLFGGSTELCHYHLDEVAVRNWLAAQ